MLETPNLYTKERPFLASIKERYPLTKAGSEKSTHHVILDLKGSSISYEVGDSLAVLPSNDPVAVQKILYRLQAKGTERIVDSRSGHCFPLQDFLCCKANITDVNKRMLQFLAERETDPQSKQELEHVLASERDFIKNYLESFEIWDLLEKHPSVQINPQELCNLMTPLLPRFYSIASSAKIVGEEVHLTVALLEYQARDHCRRGVCTHYLLNHAPLGEPNIPIYLQPHKGFTLPPHPETPIIMIGPGTGVAPFRAFMQERSLHPARGNNWLFFGERYRSSSFLYENYWLHLEKTGHLRLHTAFSRDQSEKVYVQHRMREHGAEIMRWLKEGAFLYVCGDAQRMAKDVEAALLALFQEQGGMHQEEANLYLKELRKAKRYLRDVY